MSRPVRSFASAAVFTGALALVGASGCANGPSPSTPPPGSGSAADAILPPCPPRPNCVGSLEGDVEGFVVEGSVAAMRARLERAIRADGGTLVTVSPTRLGAIWRSRVFGFVDDVEFALAPDGARFEVRSASRVGWSDLGANRRRVARLHARVDADTADRRPP